MEIMSLESKKPLGFKKLILKIKIKLSKYTLRNGKVFFFFYLRLKLYLNIYNFFNFIR